MSTVKRFREIENKDRHIPLILVLDVAGNPVNWGYWKDCVTLAWNGKVRWSLGDPIKLYGGMNRFGEQSVFDLPPVIATTEVVADRRIPLSNKELFRRDQNICMYCGTETPNYKLTRDHVIPTSKGGPNTWTNCVTACKRCNHLKADRTPEQWGHKLLAVPYEPTPAGYLILQNRRILADQMEYLAKMVGDHEKHLVN